jgi:hypothetical protein
MQTSVADIHLLHMYIKMTWINYQINYPEVKVVSNIVMGFWTYVRFKKQKLRSPTGKASLKLGNLLTELILHTTSTKEICQFGNIELWYIFGH